MYSCPNVSPLIVQVLSPPNTAAVELHEPTVFTPSFASTTTLVLAPPSKLVSLQFTVAVVALAEMLLIEASPGLAGSIVKVTLCGDADLYWLSFASVAPGCETVMVQLPTRSIFTAPVVASTEHAELGDEVAVYVKGWALVMDATV